MTQVVIDKAGDKVVAVIVARLQPQGQRMAGSLRRRLESIRLELVFQEIITIALIHQNRQLFRCICEQGAGIPLAPARTLVAQVTRECLLAPGAIARVADRRKRRQRLIAPRITQRADQRTMPAHGVATDTALVGYREDRLEDRKSTRLNPSHTSI